MKAFADVRLDCVFPSASKLLPQVHHCGEVDEAFEAEPLNRFDLRIFCFVGDKVDQPSEPMFRPKASISGQSPGAS
jgi:hypothetical protein